MERQFIKPAVMRILDVVKCHCGLTRSCAVDESLLSFRTRAIDSRNSVASLCAQTELLLQPFMCVLVHGTESGF